MESLRELLIEQMQDLYDAEKQLVKALPQMAKAAANEELREAFENHLEQTQGHVERLERAFEMMETRAKSKPCQAMKGLVEEGKETMEEDLSEPLLDSAIICAAQKVEHYEIAGYGTLVAWANSIGLSEVAEVFEETLREEKEADEKLTQVGTEILAEAGEMEASGEEGEEGEEAETEEQATGASRKGATSKSGSQRKAKRRAS
jgi:ferritin-like metal-binding protein YciE